MNDLGQIVGSSWTVIDQPNISHAFLWQNGVMTNFNTLISSGPNNNITSAGRIGEGGTILARANNSEMAILTAVGLVCTKPGTQQTSLALDAPETSDILPALGGNHGVNGRIARFAPAATTG